jgi:hypothetical protein
MPEATVSTQNPWQLLSRRNALHGGMIAAAMAGLAACGDAGPQALAAAPATDQGGTPHPVTRLTSSPKLSYATVVRRFEKTVPPMPMPKVLAALKSDPSTVKSLLEKASPADFFLFHTLDVSPFMNAVGHAAKCRTYLMGNPLIAEQMYRYDAGVMLYAPLRVAIFTDSDGAAQFAIDRPSDLFGSFGDPQITRTGRELDAKVAALLRALEFPVPEELET